MGPRPAGRARRRVSRVGKTGSMRARGRFITLEGGEGSGKSTQAAMLAELLGAILTREPGGTEVGERIRSIFLDSGRRDIDVRAETLLILAARAQHVTEVIAPAIQAGRDVVCDRYSGSTLAYQGFGRGLPVDELAEMSQWAASGSEPDLILLLELPPGEAISRRSGRGHSDRFEMESADFFERVTHGFSTLAELDPERWRKVNGSGSIEEVSRRAADVVMAFPFASHADPWSETQSAR